MTQKSVLITGCSSGIGHDAAHGLAARGWRVFATCRQEQDCQRLRSEGLESFQLDQGDAASIKAAVSQALELTGGRLDALYNNAAFAIPGRVEDLPTDALRANFETNLFGVHELTRRIIPVMRAQGHGRIVNCSSVLGFSPMAWRGSYIATKYALQGLTDTLRLEMRGTPIKVILIEPGPITSRFRANSIPHFERWIDWKGAAERAKYEAVLSRLYEERGPDRFELPPGAVTAKLVRALEDPRPKAHYMVTIPTYLAAAMNRLLPTWAQDRILG